MLWAAGLTGAGCGSTSAAGTSIGTGAVCVVALDAAGFVALADVRAAPPVTSTRMVFRALRTTYSDGFASVTCTRASARPSAAEACSNRTPAIAPWRSTSARASDTLTFRMSTTSDKASGRLIE